MSTVLPGTQVQARGLRWEVVNVEAAGEQERFRLRCVDGDLRGTEFDLLHPFEPIEPVSLALDPTKAGRLKSWLLYHEAFLLEQALGPAALLSVQPGRLQIAPYQLVPVMRALRMSRPRLLLADGVGLGKTIQAGLVMSELIARRRAHRILIVSPAGPLMRQWQREMRERFGLRFAIVSGAGELQELRRGLTLGANPFDHVSLCLTSIDFAKQEKVLQELERATWDLVVIDEAHHCVRMDSAGDWEDSRRRRLAEVLSRRCDGLLLLTATPHDGYDAHFASIVELLDPSLLDGRGALQGERYRKHVVRRLKQHVKDPSTGDAAFKVREVTPRPVPFSDDDHPAFSAFQRALLALVAPQIRKALRSKRFGEVLAFVSLLKRSVSTVAACRGTLAAIRDRYGRMGAEGEEQQEARRQRLKTLRDYRRRLERYGVLSWEEEQDQAVLQAEDMAAELRATPANLADSIAEATRASRREKHRLRQVRTIEDGLDVLVDLATDAVGEDPKLARALDEIRAIRAAEPRANILVYTEYTDSQDALVEFLRAAKAHGGLTGEVVAISGRPEHAAERERVTDRFSTEEDLVLVSTDATSEGLNLHERCHHLVHLELPYNPNRLEQRNGRIDRYGQQHVPQVRYLYLAGTFEERLLLRLVAKYERQRARLTFVPDTLGNLGTGAHDEQDVSLLNGLAQEDLSLFQRPAHEVRFEGEDPEDTDSPAYQELLAEVDKALDGYRNAARNNTWLGDAGLNADHRLVEEAERARKAGEHLGAVELLDFVCEALLADTGSANSVRRADPDVTLSLPRTWLHGLDDLPGFDADNRTLRLTTSATRLRDAEQRSLGYVGRAHPIVRRALDRVRNVRFGEADAWLDRRVSAATWDQPETAVLVTFLATAQSGVGRELERVLAVLVPQRGDPEVWQEAERWTALVERAKATPTKGLWDTRFGWANGVVERAKALASASADTLFATFEVEHAASVDGEAQDLDRWLRARTLDLCGTIDAQADLFGGQGSARPRWKTLTDPIERLAAYASDGTNPPTSRHEADGVIRLYKSRRADLDRRGALRVLPAETLGLLMLVPEGGR
jgi:superfamily II DNA or RNA helicase